MISCSQYDHIEIVCMHRYPIILTMKSGGVVKGTALDTQRNEFREECIKLSIAGEENLIVLDQISTLEVCKDNPHFRLVSFT